MEPQQEESRKDSGEPFHRSEPSEKRPYPCEPELVEWGSLLELTRGSLPGGIEDADVMSSTVGS